MRKWIVRNFALGLMVTVFGRTFHSLRAPRILFPLFTIAAIVITTDPNYPAIQWWDIILLALIAIGLWIGFPFTKWAYFKKWPVKYEELDDFQKYDFIRAQKSGTLTNQIYEGWLDNGVYVYRPIVDITLEQSTFFEKFEKEVITPKYYESRFAGLANLLPLVLSVSAIIVWFLWIFPHYN